MGKNQLNKLLVGKSQVGNNNPVGKYILKRKSIQSKLRKVVKIKLLLLVGKNPVGNNILGKTLSTSLIWSSFSRYFCILFIHCFEYITGQEKATYHSHFYGSVCMKKALSSSFPCCYILKMYATLPLFLSKTFKKAKKKKDTSNL